MYICRLLTFSKHLLYLQSTMSLLQHLPFLLVWSCSRFCITIKYFIYNTYLGYQWGWSDCCIFAFGLSSVWLKIQDWEKQNASQITTQLCGFVTIGSGTFLLHRTRDLGSKPADESPVIEAPHLRPNSSIV